MGCVQRKTTVAAVAVARRAQRGHGREAGRTSQTRKITRYGWGCVQRAAQGMGIGVTPQDHSSSLRASPARGARWSALDPAFVAAANARLPAARSAALGAAAWQRAMFWGALAAFGVGAALWPQVAVGAVVAAAALLLAATAVLRVAVVLAALGPRRRLPGAMAEPAPRIALIAPLRRESEMLPVLLEAMAAFDYPRDRLRVALALEADDPETLATAEALLAGRVDLAAWLEVVVLPEGRPKTKPRALNAAWAHLEASGWDPEIVGVFDAEDRPEAGMLRQAARALAGPCSRAGDVACAQARLGWYNAREGWIGRCFAIEYAGWFDVTLRGLVALGAPTPLGGTSVFFRTAALRRVGGWDAHNVTEDAELGMRLAAAGYRCRLLSATTLEEAATRPGAWVRQRSRWLKGYLQTWIAFSRRPWAEIRAFGPLRYLAAQVLLLGGPVSALAQPFVLVAMLDALARFALGLWEAPSQDGGAGGEAGWAATAADAIASGAAWWWLNDWSEGLGPVAPVALGALLAGQAALALGALIGLARTRQLGLAPWILTLPLYWPLSGLAAIKAVLELIVAPFYWDKTRHGRARASRRLRAVAAAEAQPASSGSNSPPRSSA